MLPVLEAASDGPVRARDAVEEMSDKFGLTSEERSSMLPSGQQTIIANRTHWAITYLVKAGLIERPQRGYFKATDEGKKLLLDPPKRIDLSYLNKFESIREFRSPSIKSQNNHSLNDTALVKIDSHTATPQEQIEAAVSQINSALRRDILERVIVMTPSDFEQLIVNIMVAMGYGAGGDNRRIGQSGDGGVDGIISEDKLGLDVVYLQAKRYKPGDRVGPDKVREFVGSLAIKRASKGVFVTTSSFTQSALSEAKQAGQRVVLIDGEHLADLMIAHNVGVRIASTVFVKEVDLNYFDDI